MSNRSAAPEKSNSSGKLADNILFFARTLRRAGMRVGPATIKDAIEAVLAAGMGSRDDFYWTLHAVLVNRREDHETFDEAFRLFWRSRELIEEMIAAVSHIAPVHRIKERRRAAESRVADALFNNQPGRKKPAEIDKADIDARYTYSESELFRNKDFAQMTAEELAEAREAVASMRLPADAVDTRRYKPDPHGRRADPRAMMRDALRTGGDLVLPKFRLPRKTHPPLVVIADISGSMSEYSRIFLHFLHALIEHRRRVHAFAFGTRLTNLTRQLRDRDPDEALAQCARSLTDWSGGTRIGEALHDFNKTWSRRVLGQGATVLLITDGLERGDIEKLDKEMDRLHRSCRRLIWLNPLLRFDGFEARASGVRAIMPHVDEFRPVHSLNSLAQLCQSLSTHMNHNDPRLFLAHYGLRAA